MELEVDPDMPPLTDEEIDSTSNKDKPASAADSARDPTQSDVTSQHGETASEKSMHDDSSSDEESAHDDGESGDESQHDDRRSSDMFSDESDTELQAVKQQRPRDREVHMETEDTTKLVSELLASYIF